MNGQSRVHLQISGTVQGVSFRYYARQQAIRLGLSGWVRNCPDGTVEAVAEGGDHAVQAFIAWCRHGPSGASVERLDIERREPKGDTTLFDIRS